MVDRSVAECHTATILPGACNRIQGYLVWYEDAARWVDVKDKKIDVFEKVAVLGCALADCTGVIQGDLWRGAVDEYLPAFKRWTDAVGDSGIPLVRVEGFNVREESRRSLVPMRKLSFEHAKIENLEGAAPGNFLGDDVELSPNLIVTEFLDISGSFPALMNVSGFVRDVSGITYSQKEVEMRSFTLQDSRGKYFQCCCHGRHSNNEAFEENAQVVVFLHQLMSIKIPG